MILITPSKILAAGVGTGGTVTGVGEVLRQAQNQASKIVAAQPESIPVSLSGGGPGHAHKIQGIGAAFVPQVLNTAVYDEVIEVSNDDLFCERRAG
jgi:cysteine synthase A